MTDSMSDLIITTGYECNHPEAASSRLAWSSQVIGSPVSGVVPKVEEGPSVQPVEATIFKTRPTSVGVMQRDQATLLIIDFVSSQPPIKKVESATTIWNVGSATASVKNRHLAPSAVHNYNVALPSPISNPLSPLSPIFVPRRLPTTISNFSESTGGKENRESSNLPQQGEHLHSGATYSSSFDDGKSIASAAEDPLIFADDEYVDDGSLKGM